MSSRTPLALVAAVALGCGANGPDPERAAQPTPAADSPAAAKQTKGKKADPLFPTRKLGWKAIDKTARKEIKSFADRYLGFLRIARTPRRAIAALTDLARAGGATALRLDDKPAAGGFYFSVAHTGTAAVFFRAGSRPITDGIQLVVTSIDAPRIVLKQSPIDEHHGFAMLQTKIHGSISFESWMVHPLALFVYVDRGDKKPVDLAIGLAADDPRFSIPDILPHLARTVQKRKKPVADPERLDLLAARTSAALVAGLAERGVEADELATAEAYLIPAAEPTYVGIDRGLIGGYGQQRRALAYAAVRGLIDAKPDRAIAVVVIDRSDAGGDGSAGDAYVHRALSSVIGGLAPDADVYDAQRTLSRSAALVATTGDKGRNKGVLVNPRSSDSLPQMVAAVTRALDAKKVQYRIDAVRGGGRRAPSRSLATLDLDAIDFSIATSGAGTPGELLSTLDLYQGYLACRAWLSHSR